MNQLLVKLNNISALRTLLDGLSTSLDAETIGPFLEQNSSPISDEQSRNLYTVKIVSGERIFSSAGSRGKVDSHVSLSDATGFHICRTRTAHASNEPRWEQSFDILVKV